MSPDIVSNRYNILRADRYTLFDHRIPVDRFVELLRDQDVPKEVCVTGLGEVFERGNPTEVSQAMQVGSSYLREKPQPTIQFAVEGKFHSIRGGYELLYDEEFYNLNQLFGAKLRRKEEGW